MPNLSNLLNDLEQGREIDIRTAFPESLSTRHNPYNTLLQTELPQEFTTDEATQYSQDYWNNPHRRAVAPLIMAALNNPDAFTNTIAGTQGQNKGMPHVINRHGFGGDSSSWFYTQNPHHIARAVRDAVLYGNPRVESDGGRGGKVTFNGYPLGTTNRNAVDPNTINSLLDPTQAVNNLQNGYPTFTPEQQNTITNGVLNGFPYIGHAGDDQQQQNNFNGPNWVSPTNALKAVFSLGRDYHPSNHTPDSIFDQLQIGGEPHGQSDLSFTTAHPYLGRNNQQQLNAQQLNPQQTVNLQQGFQNQPQATQRQGRIIQQPVRVFTPQEQQTANLQREPQNQQQQLNQLQNQLHEQEQNLIQQRYQQAFPTSPFAKGGWVGW